MLIPRIGSKQIETSQDQDQKTTKTTSGSASKKPAGVASVADSFEVAKSKTDQGFSEIYQSAKQTDTGQKELSPEEQQQVSNFGLEDLKIVDRPSVFVQDSRSRDEDRKNSGLTAPFSHRTQEEIVADAFSDKVLTQEEIYHLNTAARSSEKTSDAVKDILQGGNLRDAVNEALAKRHEESIVSTGGAGSPKERLTNLMGSIAPEPEKSGPTFGKGMISQSLGIDPTPAEVQAAIKKREEAEKKAAEPAKAPKEPSIVDKGLKAAKDLLVFLALTRTPVPAPPMEKDEYENTGKGVGTILKSKDRTPESEARKGGGGLRSYDFENYQGNIAEQIKKQLDFDLERFRALHQNPGGEEIQDDPNAIGGSKIDDGRLHVAELGITGLVGQPGQAVDQHTGPGSSTQPGGASGGDIDFGPDSMETGWSGITHQDNPGDVQFGPQEPIAGAVGSTSDSEEEEADATPRKKGPLIGIR